MKFTTDTYNTLKEVKWLLIRLCCMISGGLAVSLYYTHSDNWKFYLAIIVIALLLFVVIDLLLKKSALKYLCGIHSIDYINWRGEQGRRLIMANRLEYTSNEYHKEKQWLLTSYDIDKKEVRHFAVKDILSSEKVKPSIL
jgi:hypothetical protein